MRSAAVVHDRMNFVKDQSPHRAQHLPARLRSEKQIQRFGCSHQNVRRFFDQSLTLSGAGVAGTNFGAHVYLAAFGFV